MYRQPQPNKFQKHQCTLLNQAYRHLNSQLPISFPPSPHPITVKHIHLPPPPSHHTQTQPSPLPIPTRPTLPLAVSSTPVRLLPPQQLLLTPLPLSLPHPQPHPLPLPPHAPAHNNPSAQTTKTSTKKTPTPTIIHTHILSLELAGGVPGAEEEEGAEAVMRRTMLEEEKMRMLWATGGKKGVLKG